MARLIWDMLFFLTGSLFTYGQVQESSTPSPEEPAVRSYFGDCPDSHSQFCFHGTCRFIVQEETPACVCHPGFVGMRCEHADLLAVVATNQKQLTMTALLVMCIICCVLLILTVTLLHCSHRWSGTCGCGRAVDLDPEKPSQSLKRGAICCHPQSVV